MSLDETRLLNSLNAEQKSIDELEKIRNDTNRSITQQINKKGKMFKQNKKKC